MKLDKCPYCKSLFTVWRGFRYNEKSKKRLRLCRKCGRKYTPDDGFLRMRFSKKEIMSVVRLYNKGFSTAEVVLHFQRRGMKISRWSVILWNRKFGHLLEKKKRKKR